MELKKFEAPTLAQALQVVKRELGPEAVILSTKNKRSAWGLMNQSSVEVTAAVSHDALEKKRLAERSLTSEQKNAIYGGTSQKAAQAYDVLSGKRLSDQMRSQETLAQSLTSSAGRQSRTPWLSDSNGAPAETRHLDGGSSRSQLSPAQAALAGSGSAASFRGGQNYGQAQQGAGHSQAPTQTHRAPAGAGMTQRRYIDINDDESPAEQATYRSTDRAQISSASSNIQPQVRQNTAQKVSTGILSKLIAQLIDAGVEDEHVRDLGDELKMLMVREHITREDMLRLQLARIVMTRLRVARPLGERLRVPNTPRVISFVGPTGVGKTTTVAKIAAELVISQQRPVILATTDTYKIAAIEQLQTYASILRIPIEVCPSPEALAQLAASVGPHDVILVDTAGYGPRDEKKLLELKDTLTGVRTETHLCVSATTRDRDLAAIVKRFGMFELDYLVMTKLDETNVFGNLYNISAKSHLPLSYLTMGQRVPEDIEVASKERVADLLLNIAGGE